MDRKSASLGDIETWTINVKNEGVHDSPPADIVDTLPLGFSYVPGTATVDGVVQEPSVVGNRLTWSVGSIVVNQEMEIRLVTRITPSVKIGQSTNIAQAVMTLAPRVLSEKAEATIEIIPEHVFDCGEIIGQVFDDTDLDGYQDAGEKGIAGVKLYTLKGLKITTDKHGRIIYHVQRYLIISEVVTILLS